MYRHREGRDTESGCAGNANTLRGYAGIGSVSSEKCGAANTERGYAGIGLQANAERDVQTLVIASTRTTEYAVIWWDANRHIDGICSKY